MGKFIEALLRCLMCFFTAWFAGTVVVGVLSTVIEAVASDGAMQELIRIILETVASCVLLYIFMNRSGHKGSLTTFTGQKSVRDAVIPIIISVLLIQMIPLLNEIQYIINLPEEHSLYIAGQSKTEIFLSLLPRFGVQSVLYVVTMIFGYSRGNKKHQKDIDEMMSEKMIDTDM